MINAWSRKDHDDLKTKRRIYTYVLQQIQKKREKLEKENEIFQCQNHPTRIIPINSSADYKKEKYGI